MRPPGQMWNRKFIVIVVLLLLLQLIPHRVSTSSTELSAPEPISQGHEVTLTLTKDEVYVDVAPGDACMATLNGIVSVDYYGPSTIHVTFVCVDTWGESHTDPLSLEFSPTDRDDKPFTVIVPVPRQTACDDVGTVKVYGEIWSTLSGGRSESNSVTGTIRVNQYHCFTTLVMNDKYRRTAPGEVVEFEFKVQNTGNGMDTYSMEVLNQDELESENYVVTISQRTFDISKFSEEVIKITVTPPSGLEAGGKQNLKLAVTCEGDNGNSTLTEFETLTVNVELEGWVFVSVYLILPIILLVGVIVILVFWRRKKKKIKEAMMREKINQY
jgi:hypothetical protein